MQTTSALWDSYQALYTKQYEYKIVIGTDEYLKENIWSISAEARLTSDSEFSIGNVFTQKLTVVVYPKVTPIAKMSNVDLYVRMLGAEGPTEWLPKGKFFVDTRNKAGNKLTLVCYDKMLQMEDDFLLEGYTEEYPMLMSTAIGMICTRLGLTFANPSSIQETFMAEVPSGLTMREVAANIADANCGNFIIDSAGELRLIVPTNSSSVEAPPHQGPVKVINDIHTYDKVTLYYNETDGFEAGVGTDEFIDKNIWATQDIANYQLSVLSAYTHKPFSCNGVILNPAIELGDTITLGSVEYVIYVIKAKYSGLILCDLLSAGDTELNHEYPYSGSYSKEIKKKVTLGASYYGVAISRAEGLTISRSDGASEVILNSDHFSMRAKVDGVMTDRIYFDSVTGKYMMNGLVDIEGKIKATSGEIGGCTIVDGLLEVPAANIKNKLTASQIDVEGLITAGGLVIGTDLPTNVSDLTNDSGFQTQEGVVTIIDGRVTANYIATQGLVVHNGEDVIFSAQEVEGAGTVVISPDTLKISVSGYIDFSAPIGTSSVYGSGGTLSLAGNDGVDISAPDGEVTISAPVYIGGYEIAYTIDDHEERIAALELLACITCDTCLSCDVCLSCDTCQVCNSCDNCDTCQSCDTCQDQCMICEFCDAECTSDYSDGVWQN